MAMQHIARKALKLREVDQAVRFNEPIGPDHPFFVDFSHVRGEFEERVVYRRLNVAIEEDKFVFDAATSSSQKQLFFLGGMRGSGKTSELAKYVKNMHRPECFFCVTCNIDQELDMNDIEYTDILIFQLQKLIMALKDVDVKVNEGVLVSMQKWFSERDKEISTTVKAETGFEVGVGTQKDGLLQNLIGLFANFKAGLSGSKEWVNSVRVTFKHRFPEFADIFNSFIAEVGVALRAGNLAQEILFVVDGLEKTNTAELRRKIIIDESNRMQVVRAYTIFTLPIELMRERQRLMRFSYVESFPFVKIINQDGSENQAALDRFMEFVYRSVDQSLFESEELVLDMIRLSGGSPRELLRILDQTNLYTDASEGKMSQATFEKASKRLASQISQYITQEEWEKLKELKEKNEVGEEISFDDVLEELLEKGIVMEYNDGSDKRPCPMIELSNLYEQIVRH